MSKLCEIRVQVLQHWLTAKQVGFLGKGYIQQENSLRAACLLTIVFLHID